MVSKKEKYENKYFYLGSGKFMKIKNWIKECRKVHGNKYNYDSSFCSDNPDVQYKINCPRCNEQFYVKTGGHISVVIDACCPKCGMQFKCAGNGEIFKLYN